MNPETIIAVVGAVGGTTGIVELVRYWAGRKTERKRSEVQADSDQWHLYAEQIDALNKRIMELLEMNKEKEDRFRDQTERLRETQSRELASNERAIRAATEAAEANARAARAEQEIGDLKVRLANNECVCYSCLERNPPNEHTRKAMAEAEAQKAKPKPKRKPKPKTESKHESD